MGVRALALAAHGTPGSGTTELVTTFICQKPGDQHTYCVTFQQSLKQVHLKDVDARLSLLAGGQAHCTPSDAGGATEEGAACESDLDCRRDLECKPRGRATFFNAWDVLCYAGK